MSDSKSFKWTTRVVEGRVEKVVAPVVPALPEWGQTRVVGQPVVREDARLKVMGRARYTSDRYPAQVLHAAFLRSTVPHAKIVSIDVEAARRTPGVMAVLTGRDVHGIKFEDYPVIAEGEVRYDGQEVAAVCGISPAAVRAGLAAIRVTYQPLPFAIEAETALASPVPLTGNEARFTKGGFGPKPKDEPDIYTRGDAAGGLLHAAAVVKRTYRTPVQVHAPMETHGTVCHWEDEKLIVSESTQGVFAVRETLAQALEMPLNKIHVTCPYMGGGFGSKTRAYAHTVLGAILARRTGRPVRFILDREDEFRSPFYRPSSIQTVQVGAQADGKLTGLVLEAENPVGAHTFMSNWGMCQNIYIELYDSAGVKTDSRAVHLNQQPPVAMRGPGNMQGAWGLEQAIDELAFELKMDPVDLRLANIPKEDPRIHKPYLNNGLSACLTIGRDRFGWAAARARARDSGPVKRGVGVACSIWDGAGGPPAGALVTVATDGSVRLLTGAADLGTGTRTVLSQIVAEELALEPGDIQITNADTDDTPYTLPSYGSITLASSGPAVRQAAVDARRQLVALAAFLLDKPEGELRLERGRVVHASGAKLEIGKLADKMPSKLLMGRGERGANPEQALKTYGAQFIEVEVDTQTGVIRVLRVVAVHDSGRVINPRLWRNQVLGGVSMGLGYALLEERLHDRPTGRLLTDNLGEYKVPTLADFPPDVLILPAGVPFPGNEIGAKGVGEPPLIPTAPAIANAAFHATGVRFLEAPLTPARVLAALAAKEDRR